MFIQHLPLETGWPPWDSSQETTAHLLVPAQGSLLSRSKKKKKKRGGPKQQAPGDETGSLGSHKSLVPLGSQKDRRPCGRGTGCDVTGRPRGGARKWAWQSEAGRCAGAGAAFTFQRRPCGEARPLRKCKSVSLSPEDAWKGSVTSSGSLGHHATVALGEAALRAWGGAAPRLSAPAGLKVRVRWWKGSWPFLLTAPSLLRPPRATCQLWICGRGPSKTKREHVAPLSAAEGSANPGADRPTMRWHRPAAPKFLGEPVGTC